MNSHTGDIEVPCESMQVREMARRTKRRRERKREKKKKKRKDVA